MGQTQQQAPAAATAAPATDSAGATQEAPASNEAEKARVLEAQRQVVEFEKTAYAKAALALGTPVLPTFELRQKVEDKTKAYLATPSPELIVEIEALMKQLETSMALARGDALPLQAERTKLEEKIGEAAFTDGKANSAVGGLCESAIRILAAYIDPAAAKATELDAVISAVRDDPEFKESITDLGATEYGGYAGAVGTAFDPVLAVFTSGNVRERITHLTEFGSWFAKEVYAKNDAELGTILEAAKFTEKQIKELREQRDATRGSNDSAKKALYQDNAGSGVGVTTEGYADAKDSGMDKKRPQIPLEMLSTGELQVKARTLKLTVSGAESDEELRTAIMAAQPGARSYTR